MRIITNENLIKRYARIGQFASLAGLVLLVAGLIISFTNQEQVALSLGALLLGFGLSQVGIFFGNRYYSQLGFDHPAFYFSHLHATDDGVHRMT